MDADRIAEAYRRDGFAVAEALLSPSEVAALQAEAVAIARGARGAIVGSDPHAGGDDAIDGVLAIHFPHKISDLVRRTMRHPVIVTVLEQLIGPDVKAMQTMLFVKKAGKPGQAWHQDENFIPTRDRSLCGVWIALDDATVENGCLWMHPRSHVPGILYRTMPHNDDRFDPTDEAVGHDYAREGGVPVALAAGGVAFFHGHVLHRSLPNRSPHGYRRALVIHYMNARSLLPWRLDAQIATDDLRDIELVAGEDPYAWKGVADVTIPYIRPESATRAAVVAREIEASLAAAAAREDHRMSRSQSGKDPR